ncbi:TPA: hypothetical protein ACH3X2_002663 [Trebouxia sp. C0005]
MTGPPPKYVALANGLRDTAQEVDRIANHAPLTAAGLQQLLQQHQQQIQQQLQQHQQQIQQQLQQQQQQTQQQIQQQIQQLQQQFAQDLLQHEQRQQARTINSFATDDTKLEVVKNAAGATPPHWPAEASPAKVREISGPHLNQILQFYQLSTGGRFADRARRVLMHLGVRF